MPATGDRVSCVYLENHRIADLDPSDPIQVNYDHKVGNEPTGKENPELLKLKPSQGHDMSIVNGISRIGWMSGGKKVRWVDEDLADVLTNKAINFIEKKKATRFFCTWQHMIYMCQGFLIQDLPARADWEQEAMQFFNLIGLLVR